MSKFRSQSTISKSRRSTNTHIHANTHSNAHAHKHAHTHAHKYHYYHYYMRNIIILCCIVFSIYVLYQLFKYTYNYIYKSNTDGYTTLTTQGNEDPNTKFTVGFTNINTKDDNENKQNSMKSMKRPFLNMWGVRKDGTEFLVNIVFISHPFTRDECIIQYNEAFKQGVLFLGISSYSEFPGPVSNIHDVLHDPKLDAWTKYNYFELTRGWCSCFRDELNAKWIPRGVPVLNIAESDFGNYEFHKPDASIKKEYDFLYICLKDGDKKPEDKDCPSTWQSQIRRWDIAKKILDIMCKQFKLKGLLIGRIGCEIPPECHTQQLMETTDFLQYNDFIKQYNRCRFMLNCSESDASPRVLSENMCYDNPILVNKKILGGWQYVNDSTGAFFDPDNLDNFPQVLTAFLDKLKKKEFTTRDWYVEHYGKNNAGARLKTFVKSLFKESELNFKFDDVEYLKPAI